MFLCVNNSIKSENSTPSLVCKLTRVPLDEIGRGRGGLREKNCMVVEARARNFNQKKIFGKLESH
jgi:hypothetical protein